MNEPKISRSSLADSFKGTGGSRAAGLSALLPPAPPLSVPVPAPKLDRLDAIEEPAPKPTTKPAPVRKPGPAEYVGVQNVAVYLEPEVLIAVREAKRQGLQVGERDRTYDEILVDALETISVDDLKNQFSQAAVAGTDGPLQRRVRRPRGTGGIQIQLRLDGAQRAALDEVVASVGAPSRSALVAVVYRRYLA